MTNNKSLNKAKDSAFSGIRSIIGTLGSIIYIILDLWLNDYLCAIISLITLIILFTIVIILDKIVTRHLVKNYESDKTQKIMNWIQKGATDAGYIGYLTLAFSVFFNIFQTYA